MYGYDSAIQNCINGTVQCINACGNQCYNPTTQECFNGTVCSLGQQACFIKNSSSYAFELNPLQSECYNP